MMSLNIDKITITMANLGVFDLRENSTTCAKIKQFHIENPFKDGKLSINILMKEVKPMVMARYESQ